MALDKSERVRDGAPLSTVARNYKAPPCIAFFLRKTLVSQMNMSGAELLFVAADATWRCEAGKILDRKTNDLGLILLPEARGEPDTLLRTAFEVRERAYALWCQESEGSAVSGACSVIPFPPARA